MSMVMASTAVSMQVTRATPVLKPRRSAAPARCTPGRARSVTVRAVAEESTPALRRRAFLAQTVSAAALMVVAEEAVAASLPTVAAAEIGTLCDAVCLSALDSIPMVTTASGLQYKDIVVGKGPKPVAGIQVVVDYIAMVKNDKDGSLFTFESTIDKGKPADIRVTGDPTTAGVIPGLDEGIITMKVGGIRRVYVPGELAFPKGLASAPGRPRVAPLSPVIFDINLRYIPGMDFDADDDEDYVLEI